MDTFADRKVRDAHCDKHGPYKSMSTFRDHWTGCAQCRDDQEATMQRKAKEIRAAEHRRQAMGRSGLVGRFRTTTFDSFTAHNDGQRKALATCVAFAAGVRFDGWASLMLIGPPGTGKTHLGAAAARQVIHNGGSARYLTARDLVRTVRATWRRDSPQSEDEVIEDIALNTALLVLDEVGVGFGTDAEVAQLFDVLDKRYQACNPVLIISNLGVPELRVALGERLFDRLRERSQVVVTNWPSYRSAV
jgi:DNA replication protein DnaC